MASNLELAAALTALDWAVFSLVLLATFAAVAYGELLKRRDRELSRSQAASFLDLMLMGRRLTLPMFVASIVAAWYGGIFGVTRIAFEKGIYNFLTQGVFWYATYLIFAFFLVGRIRGVQALTLPELVGKLFGPKAEKLSAVLNLFNVIPIAYAISAGLFLQALFGGNLQANVVFGVALVAAYSIFGGMRAVVFSDFVQFVVMCLAVSLVLAFSAARFGGLGFLASRLPPSHFHPFGTEGPLAALVWGLIALATLVDPTFYQRCFAAESDRTARRGILIATAVWAGFDFCTTFGAMYARAVLPEADSGKAYLVYAVQILPPGVRGFVLAGVFSTVLSSLESYLFVAGTTVAYDLAPRAWRGTARVHYAGVALAAALAAGLAGAFAGNIEAVWLFLGSYYAACLLLPVLYGFRYPKRLSDEGFVFVCLLGAAGVTLWRLIPRAGFLASVDGLYAGIFASGAGLLASHLRGEKKRPEGSLPPGA